MIRLKPRSFAVESDAAASPVPALHVLAADAAGQDAVGAWRGTMAVLFDQVRPRRQGTVSHRADLSVYHLGLALIGRSTSGDVSYRRSLAQVRRDDLDHYLVHVPMPGGAALDEGGPARWPAGRTLRPMDVGIVDLAIPFDFIAGHGAGISLVVPRSLLGPQLAEPDRQHERVIARETPLGVVLGQHIATLYQQAPRLGLREAAAMVQVTVGLLAIALGPTDGASGEARTSAGSAIPAREVSGRAVRVFVERSLHRQDLTPETLMAELHLSRSTLYRLFERYGGVRQYIRRRRLHRALMDLCSPASARRRIGDIAYDVGFLDEAHFSRLFSATFGMSPRAARAAAQRGDGGPLAALVPGGGGTQQLAHWLRELTPG
ncbi:helix-turn-helix domain-containing protein [Azospirillum sp. B4]|uniref:helix-turn-helix domain-containing protein n=1 Tax=Azospirillum sp. B4 TaxID=95605 RepID=UPI00067852FA|nr:helix-turn-helix domain-containing protein [Azospirillum sp. B4]